MSALAVLGWGAVDGFGMRASDGADANVTGTAVAEDAELLAAGLTRPWAARADVGEEDRARVLFERALSECARVLDDARPEWRRERVGLAVGTSSGGMRAFVTMMRGSEPTRDATYLGPVLRARRPVSFEPFSLVLGACASSTLAIGLARAWVLTDRCDIALCGGFDAVSVFVASGFEALRATCMRKPSPFRTARAGLALGEGAAVIALARPTPKERAFGFVSGFGASCDATHLTAPDRSGRGLARAARQALVDARQPRVDLVSAHGTGTEYNDVAEAAALAAVLPHAADVFVHAHKGAIGHTLGAAGALETIAALKAMASGVVPASAGDGSPALGVRVLDHAAAHETRIALKLSAAFGGTNAALVLARDAREAPAPTKRDVYVSRAVHVADDDLALTPSALAARTGYDETKIARADRLVHLAMSAAAALEDAHGGRGTSKGAGVVVGHGLATVDTNKTYLEHFLAKGAHRAEPRRFPYTTPNAVSGECAVAFGWTGPAFAVGCGEHGGLEAIAVASDLVRAGVADRVVVIAVDEAGDASRMFAPETSAGAVALLVASTPLAARVEMATTRLDHEAAVGPVPLVVSAHHALLPLVKGRPESLEVATNFGGFAKARFFWL